MSEHLIMPDFKQTLKDLSETTYLNKEVYFYKPFFDKQFDWSLVVILVMACFCVAVGSACGGYSKMDL